ncbi:MAG: ABC transporter permease [Gammaproteobacteria bacterium]
MSISELTVSDAAPRRTGSLGEAIKRDLFAGIAAWRLWTMLGWNDIRERYRRSALGPFWITLSMAMFITLLGVIYSKLFHIHIATYLPYLTVGYIIWGFISSTTMESCGSFQQGERIIRQLRLPYSLYVFRVVWRNFIVFLHTIVIYIPVAWYFGLNPGPIALLAIPGLLLVWINQCWVALALAVIGTRYRDVVQMITTIVQITMFATPIMYPISALGNARIIAYVNPLYHVIDVARAPLLGTNPALISWVVSITLAVVGWSATVLLLRRATNRLVFWL